MYAFIPYVYLYGVCLYCVSISMSVSIWVLQSVECLHTPCRLILHIHIHVGMYPYGYYGMWSVATLHVHFHSISISYLYYIHINITECVYTVYLYPCLYLYGYYGDVECLHTPCRPTLHIHVHICIYMDITKCGVIIWYILNPGLF